jgi:hypothetical protein
LLEDGESSTVKDTDPGSNIKFCAVVLNYLVVDSYQVSQLWTWHRIVVFLSSLMVIALEEARDGTNDFRSDGRSEVLRLALRSYGGNSPRKRRDITGCRCLSLQANCVSGALEQIDWNNLSTCL